MNTGKRILSVFMCIAMLLSMMASFAFAETAEGEVGGVESAPVADVSTLTGAKPTTNVEAPSINASVFVVDSTVTAETTGYVLTWEGVEYSTHEVDGETVDMFVYGTNLFASIADAQAVAPVGATYLVKSVTYSVAFGNPGGKQRFTKAGNFYTEAYNTMPFVVGTAFDGSDWSLNEDYMAKTVTLNGFDAVITDAANAVGGINLYGFSVSYGSYAYDINNSTVAVNVNIVNSYYLPTASDAQSWFSTSDFARREATQSATLTVKNFYLGGTTSRFATEYVPTTTIFDGFYIPADVDMGGSPYLKQGLWGTPSHIIFRNWNIQNEEGSFYFEGNNKLNYNSIYNTPTDNKSGEKAAVPMGDKTFRDVTIENCTLNNAGFYTVAKPAITHGNALSHFTMRGVRAINTTGTTASPVGAYNKWNDHLGITVEGNYFQGYVPASSFGTDYVAATSGSTGVNINNNYLSNGVSLQGVQFEIGSVIDKKDWYASDWYVDPAMTLKASEVIGAISTSAVAKAKLGLTITLYVNEGQTASLSADGSTLTSDADLNALEAGTYTVNATTTVEGAEYTIPYTVNVIGFSNPLIQNVADATGLISGEVLIVDAEAVADKANGELVEVIWKGVTYNAVCGVTAFASLDAVQNYAKVNAIKNPSILIKVANVSGNLIKGEAEYNTLNILYPAKFFTQNYDKKPYVASDRALDPTGSEWASNVNTGADSSFNTEDGIEVKWFNLSNAAGGKYEFHGFTITNTIQDDGARSNVDDIEVLFKNLYVDKIYTNALFTMGGAKFQSYASANEYSDSVTLKDVYINNEGNTLGKGFFANGDVFAWAHITLDGVFSDFLGKTDGNKHWMNHYYDSHSITIKNCNLRNAKEMIMFQGDNGKGANKGTNDATNRKADTKHMILEDNIFYNYTLSSTYNNAFLYIKSAFHTTIKFNNNFLYAGPETALSALIAGAGGDSRQPNTYITVNNNTVLGAVATYNIARWVSTDAPHSSGANNNFITPEIVAEEDLLAGNVTAAGSIMTIPNNNHTGGVKNYIIMDNNAWMDYARTTKVADVLSNIKVYVPDGGFYLSNRIKAPTATMYLSSTATAADITVNDQGAIWLDAEGNEVDGTEITKESVNITNDEGTVVGANYILRASVPYGNEEEPSYATFDIAVTILPNTITAYPASDYARVETEGADGSVTTSMIHPTEVEVIEDMPHISGGLLDDYGMINSLNASIIDGVANYSKYRYTINKGEFKQFVWNEVTYLGQYGYSFYQNVDAAYSNEVADGNLTPEYLLEVGEWGNFEGYYGGTGGDYLLRSPGKFFTENYGIDPYYAGDEFGNDWMTNIGTDYGMFNPDTYLKAAFVTIANDAIAGRYELYGFTVGVGIKDGRTTNNAAIDLYLKNTYFSCEGANSYIFYGNESTADSLMGGSPDSKLYIENAYIASKGNRSFLRNSAWASVIFDKVYADFAENTKNTTSYFHQTYDETELVIKNSFFTNTLTDVHYFEGYNDGTNYYNSDISGERFEKKVKEANFKAGRKAIVLENNIFKNYSFSGSSSFLNVKGGFLSEIVLKNNYIDNTGSNLSIVTGVESFTGVDSEMKLVIEDNTFIGFKGDIAYTGSRLLAEGSAIQNNYAADEVGGNGKPIKTTDGITAGAYYLDGLKEVKSTDLAIKSWNTSGVTYAITDNEVLVTKTSGTPTVNDIVVDNGDITVYADKAFTEEISDLADSGTSYVKISTTNSDGAEVYIAYTVTVLGTSDNFFADKYTAPSTDTVKTKIDASKAVIIDYAASAADFGSVVTLSWMGTEYDFIKGVTAFATYSDFVTYAKKAGLSDVHVLMKTVSAGNLGSTYAGDLGEFGAKATGELNFQITGCYYTENYNIKPYTVTDGVWAVNPEFVPANGIVARWIKVNNALLGGSIEIYGFTATAAFQNTGENQSGTKTHAVDFYIENAYAMSTAAYAAPRAAFQADSFYVRQAGNPAAGSFVVKNAYVSSANDRSRTLLTQANYASEFVLDGIFVDNSEATEPYYRFESENVDEAKVILEGDSSITIKNSYATDAAYSTRFIILTEKHDEIDNKHAITFENNEFYNVTFAGDKAFIQIDGDYTDVNLVNNKIVNDFDSDALVSVIEYYEFDETADDGSFSIKANNTISSIPLKFVIRNNTLEGFPADNVAEGRGIDASSVLAGNFIAPVGMGGKALTIVGEGRTITDATFKVDAEGKLSASEIYGMTINGAAFDTDGQSADVEVRYNRTAIDLGEYLVNKYNVVEVYADEAMTELLVADDIAIDTAVVYLKVMSPDKSVAQTRVVNFTIGAAPAVAVAAVSATLYNDITMNFKTVGTEVYENVYVDFTLNGVTTAVSESTVEGDYVVFHFENIAPHLMADTISVNINADVGGVATVVGTYETTLADYLYGIKDAYADNYELTELVIDALNYGAAAQTYKKHNVEALANANLTEDEQFLEDILLEDAFEVTEKADATATWCAKGLYLDEAIDIKLGFTTTEDINDLTVKVEAADGTVYTVDSFVRRSGKYYIYFDEFNVGQVDDTFKFTIMKGTSAVSATVTYSVQSYAATAFENGNEDLQNIVKAMMLYGRSALAYSETI